jgi:kynurenine formamidase
MNKFIELSHVLNENTPVYPSDDKMKLYQTKFLEKDYYNDSRLETGMHVGTHIDASSHMLDTKKYICDYPIDKFIGEGVIFDVRGLEIIDTEHIDSDKIKEDDIVLLYTNFDKYFGEDKYYEKYPVITEKLAKLFVSKKIKMLGMDMPSPDYFPFEIHKILMEKEIIIMENLTNLSHIKQKDKFEIYAFPLNIKAEGSLARVIAKII